jgi:SAM-dependent methyltransferase
LGNVEATRAGYDAVAEPYATRFRDELRGKPLDRALLDAFAEQVARARPVADIGCGPGHATRYLHDRGIDVVGIDLSPGMVEVARRDHPGVEFRTGDMLGLEQRAGTYSGIVAFYSIIHVPRALLPTALAELRRVLIADGLLLLSFHIGTETRHLDEWWEQRVSLDFHFFEVSEMQAALRQAGFLPIATLEREPIPEIEAETRRAYVLSRADPAAFSTS